MRNRRAFRKIPPPPRETETARIQFSFKYLEPNHNICNADCCTREFFCNLLGRIKEYEDYSIDQFMDVNHQDDRMQAYFPDSACPKGFTSLDSELQSDHFWEIKVVPTAMRHSREAAWRAHGMLVGSIFYLVWLDPEHRLFPNNHPAHATRKKKP